MQIDAPSSRPRLDFLDGLRGLAALYVAMHHAYFQVLFEGTLPASWRGPLRWLDHGTLAVDLFIVLSGFCLMLPLVGSPENKLRGGQSGFFRRRARRILPPYYAALTVCLALIAFVPQLSAVRGDRWDEALPAFSTGTILSHLLLVHNFSRAWIWRIDNPMWSIATEWQIYFVFALILLPVWRKLGTTAALCVAFLTGSIIESFMPGDSEACFHFIGLFGLGMSAAAICYQPTAAMQRWRTWRWNWIAGALCAVLATAIFFIPSLLQQPKIVVDIFVGLASASLIVACVRSANGEGFPSRVTRVLESSPLKMLGSFSYSFYLMHFPLISLGHRVLRESTHLAGTVRLMILLFGVVPAAGLLCYGFHLIFERPFLGLSHVSRRPDVDTDTAGKNARLAA